MRISATVTKLRYWYHAKMAKFYEILRLKGTMQHHCMKALDCMEQIGTDALERAVKKEGSH